MQRISVGEMHRKLSQSRRIRVFRIGEQATSGVEVRKSTGQRTGLTLERHIEKPRAV